ncbi:unnamed protein product [Paramecium octaurelia]|uniref:Uncharacterized protein n=1 Tax=Paramecium octaurelia TaxID=43137 RepID=A0A8S1WUF2_PAROT|nr:unnamed protein product [Paramecium octaurelia]
MVNDSFKCLIINSILELIKQDIKLEIIKQKIGLQQGIALKNIIKRQQNLAQFIGQIFNHWYQINNLKTKIFMMRKANIIVKLFIHMEFRNSNLCIYFVLFANNEMSIWLQFCKCLKSFERIGIQQRQQNNNNSNEEENQIRQHQIIIILNLICNNFELLFQYAQQHNLISVNLDQFFIEND